MKISSHTIPLSLLPPLTQLPQKTHCKKIKLWQKYYSIVTSDLHFCNYFFAVKWNGVFFTIYENNPIYLFACPGHLNNLEMDFRNV